MLQHWLILIPEILMLLYLLTAALVNKYRDRKTPKTFFTLLRWFLLLILLFTWLFYNKSAYPEHLHNSTFTTLFKSSAYLLLMAWSYLSSKWFLNKNRHSYKYCSLLMINVLGLDIMASANSLLSLFISTIIICWCNRNLIYRHWDTSKVISVARQYSWTALFFVLITAISTFYLYLQAGSLSYHQISSYLTQQQSFDIYIKLCTVSLIALFMFLIAAAPFHFWFINFIRNGILPVSGHITISPWLIYLCGIINLSRECLSPMIEFTTPILTAFGICSILFGALSSLIEKNIRCLFAFISLYCIGLNLIGLTNFSNSSIIASFAYSITCILSFAGIYTVFLSLKSHGEYLSELDELNGFSISRPYIAATLMVFSFSLIGLAPTLGFFGYSSILYNLSLTANWWRIAFLLISTLFMAAAVFRIIKSAYFYPNTQKYDRTNKSIYAFLFINMLIIIVSLFFPSWLMRDALAILGGN